MNAARKRRVGGFGEPEVQKAAIKLAAAGSKEEGEVVATPH
jgi:hypothetical protein